MAVQFIDPTALFRALESPPRPDAPAPPKGEPPPERFQRRGLSHAPADTTPQSQATTDEIYTEMQTAVTTYINDPDPGAILLLAAPPGSGKTHLMVRAAEAFASDSRRVLFAGPNHDFYQDVMNEATQPSWWYEWQPRHGGDLNNQLASPATCRWDTQMKAWLRRGYAAKDFCANPRICGWTYVNAKCPYHAQKRRNDPIIFAQHAHVALTHPLMEHMSLVIGDESPLSAFLYESNGKLGWTIPVRDIVPPDMDPGPLETLLRNLRYLAQHLPDNATHWSGAALYQALPGGASATLVTCAAAKIPLTALAYGVDLRSPDGAEEAPYFHLGPLVSLLEREAQRVADGKDVIPRVRLGSDGLTMLLRRSAAQLPAHVVWCDATANERIYKTLFAGKSIRVVQPKAPMLGRVYQVLDSLNNKSSLVDYGAQSDGQDIDQALTKFGPKLDKVRAQIAHIVTTRKYTRPAIISYKSVVSHLWDTDIPFGHFGASRGTNRMQGCDALFVVGAPQPPLSALLDAAAALYFERDEPFDTTWSVIDVPIAGQPWAYSVGGFWNDPDLQAILYQVREAEILQAVHRARPLRHKVDIWLLTNVVIPDLLVEPSQLTDLFGARGPDGKALKVDLYRWPAVQAFADVAYANGVVTSAMLAHEFGVPAKTSVHWMESWARQRGHIVQDVQSEGRGRPSRGCVKTK